MDARAAGIVEPDYRASDLGRQIHDFADLFRERARQAAAEHGEVLGKDADLAAVDRAVAGDDAVAGDTAAFHPEIEAAMGLELVQFDEGSRVKQKVDALARGHPAVLALLFQALLAPAQFGLARQLLHPLYVFFKSHDYSGQPQYTARPPQQARTSTG